MVDFAISSKKQLIAPVNHFTYNTVDFSLNSPPQIQSFQSSLNAGSFYGGLCWDKNGDKFFITKVGASNTAGLYVIDFFNGTATKLIQFCDTKRIKYINQSPDGSKLIYQKVNRINITPEFDVWNFGGETLETSSIWLYDVQTKKEAKINLE